MTKISVYNIDEYVTADDKWIGTDVNTYNKTKNFTPRKLSHYFNNNQVINTGVDLLYKYFTITPPETRPTGTLSFKTEIGQTVNFSAISTFLLSKTTLKGNDVVEFLNFLVGTKVLLYKAKNINLFGSYKIVSVEEYLPEPNFLVINVEFIEGNGFIEEDEDYMISIIDINSSEIQDLQNVTNIGNTTTNSIIANSFVKIGGIGNNVLLDNGTTIPISGIGGNQNLQQVVNIGNAIVLPSNADRAIDILLPDLVGVASKGILVTIEAQTGLYPNPDAYVARIKGQNPGSLPNFISGFYAVVTGADNYSVASEHNIGAVTSTHFHARNETGVTSDFANFYTNVNVFKIDYLGNTTAAKFIKEGGISTQFLKADGSVDSTIYTTAQNLQQVTNLGAETTNTITILPIGNNIGLTVEALGNQPAIYADSLNGDGIQGFSYSQTGVLTYSQTGAGLWAESRDNIPIRTFGNGNGTPSVEVNLGNTNKGIIINSGASSTGNFIELDKNGVEKLSVNQQGELTATKLIKEGGTSAQLLAANGDTITAGTNITISGGQISSTGGTGGGSSVNFYLNGSIASSVAGYRQIGTTAVIGAGTDFSLIGNGTIAQFLTAVGSPGRLEIPSGAWNFELWLQAGINNSGTKVHVDLYKYDGAFTLIASGASNPINLQTNTNTNLYVTNISIPQTTLLVTDRLAVRVIASNSTGNHIVTLHTENGNICEILTNFVGGVTAINGITQQSQTLATGTTGTNFAINSSGSTHTFNLPDAGTVARGVVTINNQSFAGLKTFTDNIIVNGININRGNNNAVANIAIGLDTLDNTSGNQNTVIGYQAASNDNITPLALSFNTVLGYQAYGNGAANNNTAIGWQSLFSSAANNNSALGYSSGLLLTTGFQNTFIGAFAGGFTGQKIDAQNSIAIGYQAFTTKNNQVVLGNSLTTETVLNGNIVIDLPTTSTAGTYSFLTRDTASGVIQKILSTSVQTAITLGAIGASPNANGATLTAGGSLVLQPASGTVGGVITTGVQTIAGNKTFTGTIAGITKTMVGLSNVDNTSDIDKPISTATQTALNLKVDSNTAIIGDTKTKITYDSKGLVTAGADITTADLSDFDSASRAQTEAALVAGSNITITPAGSGATRTLTIASTGVVAQNAFTILANNTNATALPTEQPFENITNDVYSGTIVWTGGAAPSGTTSHTYSLSQVGNLVTLTINLAYGAAGASSLSNVTMELPSTAPQPAAPSSVTTVGDILSFVNGNITTTKLAPTANSVSIIRLKSTSPNVFEISISRAANSYRYAYATIQYFV